MLKNLHECSETQQIYARFFPNLHVNYHIDGKSPEGLLIFALNLCFLPCIVAHIPEVVIGTSQEG